MMLKKRCKGNTSFLNGNGFGRFFENLTLHSSPILRFHRRHRLPALSPTFPQEPNLFLHIFHAKRKSHSRWPKVVQSKRNCGTFDPQKSHSRRSKVPQSTVKSPTVDGGIFKWTLVICNCISIPSTSPF